MFSLLLPWAISILYPYLHHWNFTMVTSKLPYHLFQTLIGGYDMGVSKNRGGPPKWMVKIMEKPIDPWMIWGENPLFSETSISKFTFPMSYYIFLGGSDDHMSSSCRNLGVVDGLPWAKPPNPWWKPIFGSRLVPSIWLRIQKISGICESNPLSPSKLTLLSQYACKSDSYPPSKLITRPWK